MLVGLVAGTYAFGIPGIILGPASRSLPEGRVCGMNCE